MLPLMAWNNVGDASTELAIVDPQGNVVRKLGRTGHYHNPIRNLLHVLFERPKLEREIRKHNALTARLAKAQEN